MKMDQEKTTSKKKTNMLLASFILFIFPIIFTLLGVFLGEYIGKSIGTAIQTSQILGGIIAFVLSLIIIKLFDRSAVIDDTQEKIHWDDM